MSTSVGAEGDRDQFLSDVVDARSWLAEFLNDLAHGSENTCHAAAWANSRDPYAACKAAHPSNWRR